jgi:hypothetical protein
VTVFGAGLVGDDVRLEQRSYEYLDSNNPDTFTSISEITNFQRYTVIAGQARVTSVRSVGVSRGADDSLTYLGSELVNGDRVESGNWNFNIYDARGRLSESFSQSLAVSHTGFNSSGLAWDTTESRTDSQSAIINGQARTSVSFSESVTQGLDGSYNEQTTDQTFTYNQFGQMLSSVAQGEFRSHSGFEANGTPWDQTTGTNNLYFDVIRGQARQMDAWSVSSFEGRDGSINQTVSHTHNAYNDDGQIILNDGQTAHAFYNQQGLLIENMAGADTTYGEAASVADDGWGNKTYTGQLSADGSLFVSAGTQQIYNTFLGQARVAETNSISETRNLDGSLNYQESQTWFAFDHEGHLQQEFDLNGNQTIDLGERTQGQARFITEDQNLSYTVGDPLVGTGNFLDYEVINNQARILKSTSISDSSAVDGSPSHSLNVVDYSNDQLTGKLTGAVGQSAFWSVDAEGNVTQSGVINNSNGREEIEVAGGNSTFIVLFGQARQVLNNTNTVTTSVDGTLTDQDLSTFTEFFLDSGRLKAQNASGTWTTTDPLNNETDGEVNQLFEIITGQARLTLSDSYRTDTGPLFAHTASHVENTYNALGMMVSSDARSEVYGSDGLFTSALNNTVYSYDTNNKRISGTISGLVNRYDYDSDAGVDFSVAVETVESLSLETYQQVGERTRRVQVDNTSDQSSIDTSYNHQEITNYYAFNMNGQVEAEYDMNQNGEIETNEITHGVGTSLGHSGHDNPNVEWRQVNASDWWDTTESIIAQSYEIRVLTLGSFNINIAKLGNTQTQSETISRDNSYNHQVLDVTNRYETVGLRILLDRTIGHGEILEAHSGKDSAVVGGGPDNRDPLNEQDWWDTTVGTIDQEYTVFFGSLAKLARTETNTTNFGREGNYSESSTIQTNAYTTFGKLVEENENGERTEAFSVQKSHSGSDRIFLFDVDSSDVARILPLNWKNRTEAERAMFLQSIKDTALLHDAHENPVTTDPWWDTTTSSVYQSYQILRGQQARISESISDSNTFHIDGSYSNSNITTAYNYNQRNMLVSAEGNGSQVTDDGNGNYIVGNTRQIFASINGQARVTDTFSKSDPASADGSVSHQANYQRTGYLSNGQVDVAESLGKSASWAIDTEGNITTSGVLDDEGYVDIDATTQNFQTFVMLNGQAKVLNTRSVSTSDNIDGSRFEQTLDVLNDYVTVHDPQNGRYLGRLEDGTGVGTWISHDGIDDTHVTTGLVWQNYDFITGQNRLVSSGLHRGNSQQIPNIDRDPNTGEWLNVPLPLYAQTGGPIYAHQQNYTEIRYDENGATVWNQSASDVFNNEGFMSHSVQKAIYDRAIDIPSGRMVRVTGRIDGRTSRYEYWNDNNNEGQIDTTVAVELTYFNTVETYEQKPVDGQDFTVTRRTLVDTTSRTYDLAGTYNKQHINTSYAYDNSAVLENAVGRGSFVSHSGRDNEDILPGQDIEDSWLNTLTAHPEEVWDTTIGTIDQNYHVYKFGPNEEVGIARLSVNRSVSDTVSRDLSYTHQDSTTYQVYTPAGHATPLRLVLEYDTNGNGVIELGERTEGTGTTVAHSGRNENDSNPFTQFPGNLMDLQTMSDSQIQDLSVYLYGAQGGYNRWWDTTTGTSQTTYVDPTRVFNQLKVNTQTSNNITLSRDGSQNIQNNTVTYKYGRTRLPADVPLTDRRIYEAENNGPLLLGAFGQGSFVQDDGNGNLTVGSTEQRYRVTRGQRAQVGEATTVSDSSATDGGVSHQINTVRYNYLARSGRLNPTNPAEGFGSSYSIDGDGNITSGGAIGEKDASEATPFDVTNEKVLPFGLDAINQREGINGLYGVHQFFTLLNGQARVHRTESINRIDGSDGSTQVQEIVNTTAYNAIGHVALEFDRNDDGIIQPDERTAGGGTWVSYDGITDDNYPLGHETRGTIWQDFVIRIGQARMGLSQQNRGTDRLTPNVIRDPNTGEWLDVNVPLFTHDAGDIYAHTENYLENTYDDDGILTLSQSANNNFAADEIMTHSWQKAVYTREYNSNLNRWVRTAGDINGFTFRYDYDSLGGDIHDELELEKIVFNTHETYELKGINNVVRRTETDTISRTYAMDGSYNNQHLIANYSWNDQTAKLEAVQGNGNFESHSGRDDESVTWEETLASQPQAVWDWTKGGLQQNYEIIDFGPNGEVGIGRIIQTMSLSDTVGRDLGYTHQLSITNFDNDDNARLIGAQGTVYSTSHSGRDLALFVDPQNLSNNVDFQNRTSDWQLIAEADRNWWDTTVSETEQNYLIIYNQAKILNTDTTSSTVSRDLSTSWQRMEVDYKYRRNRLPADTPLTSSEIYAAPNNGAVLVGAYGHGTFGSQDGGGGLTVGSIEQKFRVVRGQQARLDEQTTVSDGTSGDGSPSHSLTTVKYFYNALNGRLDKDRPNGPAEGIGSSWSIDNEGTITMSGYFADKADDERTPYDVTTEKVATFQAVDPDLPSNRQNVNQEIGILEEGGNNLTRLYDAQTQQGLYGQLQTYSFVMGQARLATSTNLTRSEGLDGSFNVQRVTVANDYVEAGEPGFAGQLENTTGEGRWTAWSEDENGNLTVRPYGTIWQNYLIIGGQGRLEENKQHEGDVELATNLQPGPNGDWIIPAGFTLYGTERRDTQISAHTDSYSLNEYDSNGSLLRSRSASENYSADNLMSRAIQNTVYTTRDLNGRVVRDRGDINGTTQRFSYDQDSNTHEWVVDTSVALENGWFVTVEDYDVVGPGEIVRRIQTDTESETTSMDTSLNHQWLVVDYEYDNDAVLVRADGDGHFFSHSGVSDLDGEYFDRTDGRIIQTFDVILVGPGSVAPELRVGVARINQSLLD